MSFLLLNRRDFAGDLATGDFAIPSLANPVQVNPDVAPLRSDFTGGKVAQVGGAFVDYWGGIWDIMTGKESTEAENFTSEEKAQIDVDAGGNNSMPYFLMLVVSIGTIYYLQRGR
jgi:hypothetical protein